MPPREFSAFAGAPVLVTGHTGFKGAWLSIWLHRLGAAVSGYSLAPPTSPSHFESAGVRDLLTHHVIADVRDRTALRAAIDEANPRVIFHLAAQSLVREGYEQPFETFDVNAMGTAALLDAVRLRRAPCVVIVVTSDKCYENSEHVWGYREIDPMGGRDPYSASKGVAELVTSSYRQSFFPPDDLARHGIAVASTRAGNVIGGGDWAKDRIVVDAIGALTANEPIVVRNPASVRPWQHVLEPLSGYLQLAARLLERPDPALCSAWNFGPATADCLPVARLVDSLCTAWGGGRWVAASTEHAPHEAKLLRLSIDKAETELDWHPRWRLAEAVARTVGWYRAFHEGARGPALLHQSLADIEAYG